VRFAAGAELHESRLGLDVVPAEWSGRVEVDSYAERESVADVMG
jgi:hypothetical protein